MKPCSLEALICPKDWGKDEGGGLIAAAHLTRSGSGYLSEPETRSPLKWQMLLGGGASKRSFRFCVKFRFNYAHQKIVNVVLQGKGSHIFKTLVTQVFKKWQKINRPEMSPVTY